jgi:hypothetical protein
MQTRQLDNGTFNNYATEPQLYYASYPSSSQQEAYKMQGAWAVLLVSALIFTSFAITTLN